MNRKLAAVVASAAVGLSIAVSACGPSTSSTASNAKQAASAADAQLTHDGYTPTHLPGFGKADLGISNGQYRYEAVYTYSGHDAKLMQDALQNAQDKLTGKVQVSYVPNGNLIVAKAATLSDLKTAAKAIAKAGI